MRKVCLSEHREASRRHGHSTHQNPPRTQLSGITVPCPLTGRIPSNFAKCSCLTHGIIWDPRFRVGISSILLVVMFPHPMPGHLVVVGGLTVRGAKNPVTYMTYMDIAFAGRIPLAHASGLVCVGTLGGFRESLPCAVGRLARVLAISQPLVYIRAAFSTQLAC